MLSSAPDRGAAVQSKRMVHGSQEFAWGPLVVARIAWLAARLGTRADAKAGLMEVRLRDALFAKSVHLAGWSTPVAVAAV